MKFMLDECITKRFTTILLERGHDAVHIGSSSPRLNDEAILARAVSEQRVLITEDNDFCELAIARGQPHCGIIRIAAVRPDRYIAAVLDLLVTEREETIVTTIYVIEPGSWRRHEA